MDTWAETAPGHLAPEVDADVEREFWAIVCGDADLLRAEFEAVVGSLEPPRRIRDRSTAGRGHRRERTGDTAASAHIAPDGVRPVTVGAQERSPPRAET